eukprot:PhF_6_TR27130/c0_g1_i1/m.39573
MTCTGVFRRLGSLSLVHLKLRHASPRGSGTRSRITPRVRRNITKKKDIIPVIVDIGVNDGSDISIWAQVFLQQRMPIGVQPAHLFLFEPLETFSAIIKKKVKSLKSVRDRIHFYEAAVGRKHNREVKFIGDHVVARIVSKNDDPKAALAANQTVRVVKQVSLIDSIRETLPKEQNNNFWIPFLKIDCEGHDPNILLNSQILFKQQRVEVIVFELNQFTQEAVDLSTKYRVAMKMLKSYGYRLYLHAIDPHLKLSSNTQQFVLVEITEFTSWPIFLEIMVAIKGSSVSTLLPEVTQRTDSYVLHSYFRSIARSRVLKTTWSKKLYDETSLQLADEYRRVAGLCTIHPNRTSQCITSVHVLSCKHCDWVRSWRYAKSWEVDVLGWRLKIRF